ncbi:MAG: 16S rRNA (cytosine(1402)-N(4))-methyltransferase [candidate division Zixibacteria bacterium RBG_16_53_22]|nr:MAG: 16S rRNA (cytosine(1402)-N(4))-methyltransferase [candidate division Zixibacteria bacterium RBG_16_53_22]
MSHVPVMAGEIAEIFAAVPDGIFIDATFGLGGHSAVISKSFGRKFRIIGIDRDPEMLARGGSDLPENIKTRQMRFSELPAFIENSKISSISGVLFDLGLNSAQLDDEARGFSFTHPGPIDMRFDRTSGPTAAELIAKTSESDLIRILKEYGQERQARAIARAIVRERPNDTQSMALLIKGVVGPQRFTKSAARIFQALRIYVNRELEELKTALSGVAPLVDTGGRLAVISYHSLEDGIVKRQFLLDSGKCFCGPAEPRCVCGKRKILKIMTRKPLTPALEEMERNPRARSAKLRYAERI